MYIMRSLYYHTDSEKNMSAGKDLKVSISERDTSGLLPISLGNKPYTSKG